MSRRWWEWPRAFDWEPERTALVVVDMQRGFVDPGAVLEVPMARAQVPVIASLLDAFRSRSLPVVYTRFVVRDDFFFPFYAARAPERGLDLDPPRSMFAPDSDDAAIADALAPRPGEPVVDKAGYDGFAETSLEGILRSLGVDTLVLCGTVVNWCVDSTLRGAFHRRFDSIVVADAVSGYDHVGLSGEDWVRAELDFFAEALAVVLPSEELIGALDDPALRSGTR